MQRMKQVSTEHLGALGWVLVNIHVLKPGNDEDFSQGLYPKLLDFEAAKHIKLVIISFLNLSLYSVHL